MSRKRRLVFSILGLALVFICLLGSWIQLGGWPDPKPMTLRWSPDAIVVLGGGDDDRIREGKRLADIFQDTPLIVTGDGGVIQQGLLNAGLEGSRMEVEPMAESTMENAEFTAAMLGQMRAKRVVLVTNWFHVPRALAVFRGRQPGREFAASFEVKPVPLPPWDRNSQRRERIASIWYLIRHGIWSF